MTNTQVIKNTTAAVLDKWARTPWLHDEAHLKMLLRKAENALRQIRRAQKLDEPSKSREIQENLFFMSQAAEAYLEHAQAQYEAYTDTSTHNVLERGKPYTLAFSIRDKAATTYRNYPRLSYDTILRMSEYVCQDMKSYLALI